MFPNNKIFGVITIWFFIVLMIIITVMMRSPTVKGYIGERTIRLHLKKLNRDEYYSLHNILLKNNGRTTQIDHIVVSLYGIFVIETKNYAGWIFGSERGRSWTQVIYKKKLKFNNPLYQNYGHIKALDNVLSNVYKGPYHSIIAFSSRATLKEINIKSANINVVNSSQILDILSKKRLKKITKSNMQEIILKINKAAVKDKNMHKDHVAMVQQNVRERRTLIHSKVCPECKGNLIQRIGKYGRFIGCSNYPKCRFTIKY